MDSVTIGGRYKEQHPEISTLPHYFSQWQYYFFKTGKMCSVNPAPKTGHDTSKPGGTDYSIVKQRDKMNVP